MLEVEADEKAPSLVGVLRDLLQDRRLLSIEAATLRQSGRIETIARGTLGMEVPKPTRIVTMKEGRKPKAAGRVR